jgi:diguanylate cyclase (GGDEF)-like protein
VDLVRDLRTTETRGAAASTDQLRAEIGRLTRELAVARARIVEFEARVDIDPLVEVLNRRGFERELARLLAHVRRYGTPAALMLIDLDRFKAVNDAHGHVAGDALLKAVAAGLAARVRASDVVGRLGGDEFGLLLWNIGKAPAETKARELEALIEAVTVVHGDARLAVGASAGAVPLAAGATPAQVLDAADRAMYARKREKRG